MLLKIPTYTLTQSLQHCAFLKENFHIKTDVGIARTLKTQEVIFMHISSLNIHFGRNLFFLYHSKHNKNKLLTCLSQQNKTKKIKGSSKHYDTYYTRHFIIDSPHTWAKQCPQWI